MALGFGGGVANLKATLTLDDDGFIRGMADASAKLDAYNAKLKEQGVGSRLATMATRDYARQLYDEAKTVDQATASHGRLYQMLTAGQRHWKLLSVSTAAAGLGIVALTGHMGSLLGVLGQLAGTGATAALPVLGAALTGLVSPFTTLAAVVESLATPLTALLTLFGVVGAGAGIGLYKALTGTATAFQPVRKMLKGAGQDFHDLSVALGKDFLPYAEQAVSWLDKFLKYGEKLAGMHSLSQVIHSISHQGMAMLQHLNRAIYDMIGKPILAIFEASFGRAGKRINHAFAHMLDVWKPLVGKMWDVFSSWFDRHHFEQKGAEWAAAIVNTAVPVIASALWNAVKGEFENVGAWGKIGLIAGAAFAANFFTAGGLGRLLLGGGRGLVGLLGRGAAAGAGAAGAGEVVAGAGGGAAAGAGILSASAIAPVALALVPIVAGAAAAYYLGKANARPAPKGPGGVTPSRGSSGSAGFDVAGYAKDTAALKKLAEAQKGLNQYISDGGKSVTGWKIAVHQATKQANDAQAAIHDMAQKGLLTADQAASQSKQNLQNYINQEDAIARKATAASQNTSKFGAATRAQYAHVAALARTSAQLAAAIDSIPSQKYVSLVLSVTENLKTQGLNPGNARTQAGLPSQRGSYIGGTGTGDTVPALLEPGEGVLNRNAVAALGGKPAIDAINAAVPRFASGGVVLNYAGGVPPSKITSSWGFKVPKLLDQHEHAAIKKAVEARHKALQHAKTPKQRHAAWVAYNHAVAQAKAARRGGLRGAGEAYYNRIQTNIGNWIGLEQSSQDPNMDATLSAMYARELSFIKGGLAWAHKHKFNEGQWLWDARNLENTIAGQKQQQTAASAQEIASFLSTQQGFLSEFAGNIILPGAQAILSGSSNLTSSGGGSGPRTVNRTAGGRGGVVIHNHFTQTPPDEFVHIRKAKLQAEAVWS